MTMSVCIWGLFSFIVHLFLRRRRFFWEAPSQNDSEAYISKVVSVLWCADIRYIRYNSFLRFWSIHAITYSFWAFMPVYLFWFFLSNVTHGNECWLLLISAGWCWLMLTDADWWWLLRALLRAPFVSTLVKIALYRALWFLTNWAPDSWAQLSTFSGSIYLEPSIQRTLESTLKSTLESTFEITQRIYQSTRVLWTCCALFLDAIASL